MDNLSRQRRSIRFRGYDYAQAGVCFVTVCVEQRLALLGNFTDNQLWLSESGKMVEALWLHLPSRFPGLALDHYVVMPNHFHGIVALEMSSISDRATTRVAPTLGDIVGAWKSLTTNSYIKGVQDSGWPHFPSRLWQRNYYERVVRTERELDAIREYIALNPMRWNQDSENPEHA